MTRTVIQNALIVALVAAAAALATNGDVPAPRNDNRALSAAPEAPANLSLSQQRLLHGLESGGFGRGPVSFCWSPGVDPGVVRAFTLASSRFEMNSLSPSFYLTSRWTRTATEGSGLGAGDPVTLTWGILPDGVPVTTSDTTLASELVAVLDSEYGEGPGGTDLTQRPWFPIFEQAFNAWNDQIGIHYVYEPNDDGAVFPNSQGVLGVRPDVRISGRSVDGSGSGILAFNFFPNNGDMVIDTDNAAFLGNAANNSIGFRNLLTHEHGHGIGLLHSCPQDLTKLMEPSISVIYDGPQHDDILGGNRHYGDRLEHPGRNDLVGTATSLTVPAIGDTLREANLSIDSKDDHDFLALELPDRTRLWVTMTPVGFRYFNAPQEGDGFCPSGQFFDSRLQNNLGFRILAPNGIDVIADANFRPLGQPEFVESVLLDEGTGMYFIEVLGDTVNAQLYDLEWSVAVGEPPVAICKDVTSCNNNVNAARFNNGSFDPDDDPLTFALEPPGPYPPGENAVMLIVSDGILADTCNATMTVNAPPVALGKNVSLDSDSTGACINSVSPEAVDNGSMDPEGGDLTFSLVPPGPFASGETVVGLVVTDPCGLSDTAEVTVTVNCMVPVKLLSLVAERSVGSASLRWVVASAEDHAGFHVYREEPGASRVKLTETLLRGSTEYTFLDGQPPHGAADYWLQELSRGGEVTWHGPAHLEPAKALGLVLAGVYPNPFAASARISYLLPESGPVSLVVYDARGRKIRTLVNQVQPGGEYQASWDGRAASGRRMSAGLYFLRLEAGGESRVQKAVLSP